MTCMIQKGAARTSTRHGVVRRFGPARKQRKTTVNEEKSKIIAELADYVRSDLPVRRGRIPDSSLRYRPRQRGQGRRAAAQAGGVP